VTLTCVDRPLEFSKNSLIYRAKYNTNIKIETLENLSYQERKNEEFFRQKTNKLKLLTIAEFCLSPALNR
jgi:hypothetical protein